MVGRKKINLGPALLEQIIVLRQVKKYGYRTIANIINEQLPEAERISYQYVRKMVKANESSTLRKG